MKNIPIITIMLLLLLAGVVWLQIFLSKKKNKYLGLVIPIICFIFSIMTVVSLPIYTTTSTSSGTTIKTETSDGMLIGEKTQVEDNLEKPSIGQILVMTLPAFLVSNIPTVILLAIYFACREKNNKKIELEKMNVQDLE